MDLTPAEVSNEGSGGTHLLIAVAALSMLATWACTTVESEVSGDAPFVPTRSTVQDLMRAGRVREALPVARQLFGRFPGASSQALVGWALWRNGDLFEAERFFRRASESGSAEGAIGLAYVAASKGNTATAHDLAERVRGVPQILRRTEALLAALDWVAGDLQTARRHLSALDQKATPNLFGELTPAMMDALGALQGESMKWTGAVSVVSLIAGPQGTLLIPVAVDGAVAHLLLSFAAPRSWLSPRFAGTAGLVPERSDAAGVGPQVPPHVWPAPLLSAADSTQVLVREMQFGSLALHNQVLGVGATPKGADGVLGADVLTTLRWTLDPTMKVMAMLPPGRPPPARSTAAGELLFVEPHLVEFWAQCRVLRSMLTVQLFLFPRVDGAMVSAALDRVSASTLDAAAFGPESAVTRRVSVRLGGWNAELKLPLADLGAWAQGGLVAPRAVLGSEIFAHRRLHWFPRPAQLSVMRLPGPAATVADRR